MSNEEKVWTVEGLGTDGDGRTVKIPQRTQA